MSRSNTSMWTTLPCSLCWRRSNSTCWSRQTCSATSLAGKDCACPLGAIFCASMMLRESFGLAAEAEWIETAIDQVLASGYRTVDIAEPGSRVVGCSGLVELIRSEMHASLETLERYGWGV